MDWNRILPQWKNGGIERCGGVGRERRRFWIKAIPFRRQKYVSCHTKQRRFAIHHRKPCSCCSWRFTLHRFPAPVPHFPGLPTHFIGNRLCKSLAKWPPPQTYQQYDHIHRVLRFFPQVSCFYRAILKR